MDLYSIYGILDGNIYRVDNYNSAVGTKNLKFDEMFNSMIDDDLENIFQDVSSEYGVDVNLLKAVAQSLGWTQMRHHGAARWELCSLCLQRHKVMG